MRWRKLNHVVNQQEHLDVVFGALSSSVRRRTIVALESGSHTVSELAAPHGMSLGGFMKHLRVLSEAGLVTCLKDGRTVTCSLTKTPLTKASRWLASREQVLNARLDALGRHLYHRGEVGADQHPTSTKQEAPR